MSSWRKEAEALRLATSDDPKRLLQRKNKSQIVDSENSRGKVNTKSVGVMVSSVFVSALVLALSREQGKKAISGGSKPSGIIQSMLQKLGNLWGQMSGGSSGGRVGRSSSSQSYSRTPAQMAGAAAVARNAPAGGQQVGKKKKKKKKKRSH